MMRLKIALVIFSASFAWAGLPARAGEPQATPAMRGEDIAKTRCARCHAIDAAGTSPYPGAYPFRKVLERWNVEDLTAALTRGIIASHPPLDVTVHQMKLSPEEAADFTAYLQTLKPGETIPR